MRPSLLRSTRCSSSAWSIASARSCAGSRVSFSSINVRSAFGSVGIGPVTSSTIARSFGRSARPVSVNATERTTVPSFTSTNVSVALRLSA
jgi:hypothetical protein